MKHMLLVVSGMTPQIITETLYGIYRQDPAKYPSRIEVITTQEGRERLEKNLLGDDSPLHRLQQDYQLPPTNFSSADIKVPLDDDGQPLEDVRSEREQEIITDFITQHVRGLTADPKLAIHASLAGGRKTMGFALGYAMSLFGRPQDCLSHVLVNEPYESVPDFYYPTPDPVWRADNKKSGQYDLSQAKVSLASIPLVLMREEMPTRLITNESLSYTQTVERVNRANALSVDTASVTLDFDHLSLHCDGEEIFLKPDCFAFYSWLAQDSKANPGEGIGAPTDEMKPRELDARLTDFFRSILHPKSQGQTISDINSLFNRIKNVLPNLPRYAQETQTPHEDTGTLHQDIVSMLKQKQESQPSLASAPTLLQESDSNRILYLTNERTSDEYLFKRHKDLWARLLRETNKALTDALGERLAKYYCIDTVSSMPGKFSRSRYDYKGLKLRPENIHIK